MEGTPLCDANDDAYNRWRLESFFPAHSFLHPTTLGRCVFLSSHRHGNGHSGVEHAGFSNPHR